MNTPALPPFLAKILSYRNAPVPAVDPADIRAVYNYGSENHDAGTGNAALSHSIYEERCSPGAETAAVWYRASLLGMSLNMMAVPTRDLYREKLPNTPMPEYLIPAPEWLRQDLSQAPPPDYVFAVVTTFPFHGPSKAGGMSVNFAFIAEFERARSAAPPRSH